MISAAQQPSTLKAPQDVRQAATQKCCAICGVKCTHAYLNSQHYSCRATPHRRCFEARGTRRLEHEFDERVFDVEHARSSRNELGGVELIV